MNRDQKQFINSLGFRYLSFLVLYIVCQVGFSRLFAYLLPAELFADYYLVWIMLPMYLVCVPAGYFMIRGLPATGHLTQEKTFGPGQLILAILIMYGMMYAGNLVGTFLNMIISALAGTDATYAALEVVTTLDPLQNLLIVGLLGPVIEELFFRKFLIDRLNRFGEVAAIVISASAFGLFHGNITQFFYATLIGLVLGYIYEKSGKIHYSIIAHATLNILSGVIAGWLLQVTGYSELTSTISLLEEDFEALLSYVTEHLGSLLAYGAYSTFLSTLSMAGIVLTIIFVFVPKTRKIHFTPGPDPLPQGEAAKTVLGNVSVILFIAVCVLMMVTAITGLPF